jgi:hypothetical protein
MYITWQAIYFDKDKLNWWCMNVYEIVNETGQFRLLVFQREYEHENREFELGLFIKIMALDVNCQSKLTFF